jgi:cytochrome c biogenesis protein ResB
VATVPGGILKLLKKIWTVSGHLDLAVAICLLLAVDAALAYPLIQKHLTTFIPLGEVGLITWVTTYGRYNLGHTFWFYGLMLGLILLGINTFVCTTNRVWAILGPKRRRKGWLYKLGPHIMHYAVLVMVSGYLGSYTLAQALPGRALIPDGPPLKLPGELGFLSVSVENPVVYQGQRLPFFDNWFLDPGFQLTFTGPDGRTVKKHVAYNKPARYRGYNFYLSDFYPKNSVSQGMAGYKTVKLSIRRDPAAIVYMVGILLFACGIIVYLADLYRKSRLTSAKEKPHEIS